MTGRAFVLHKAKELGVEDRPVQTLDGLPGDHILVRPAFTGICGSDVHYAQTGRCGDFIVKEPMILGASMRRARLTVRPRIVRHRDRPR